MEVTGRDPSDLLSFARDGNGPLLEDAADEHDLENSAGILMFDFADDVHGEDFGIELLAQFPDDAFMDGLSGLDLSTGELHFPNEAAANIAVRTVMSCLNAQKGDLRVIFNVFKDVDLRIYQHLLGVSE